MDPSRPSQPSPPPLKKEKTTTTTTKTNSIIETHLYQRKLI